MARYVAAGAAALVSDIPLERIGRRSTLLLTDLVFAAGAMLCRRVTCAIFACLPGGMWGGVGHISACRGGSRDMR